MNFCFNCGEKLEKEDKFCSKCGTKLKDKSVGKGKSIASMVLGIIAVVWSFFVLLCFENIGEALKDFTMVSQFVGFFIGLNLISLPCGIIGLSLGLSSKFKNGQRLSGIITSSISLFVALLSLIVIFSR